MFHLVDNSCRYIPDQKFLKKRVQKTNSIESETFKIEVM